MKLVIPKSIPNVHLLQADSKGPSAPPVSGAYPAFHDGAKSGKKLQVGDATPNHDVMLLGDLLSTGSQLAYKQLQDLMEILPRMINVERKQQAINTCLRLRELFYKLTIVVEFLAARQNDVVLTYHGIKTLKSYGEMLTKTADSLTVSIDQTLCSMSPGLAIRESLQLISTGQCSNFPSIITSEFTTISGLTSDDREFWVRRLDNEIKRALLQLDLNGKCKVKDITDGVLSLQFSESATVKLTLVPIFETTSFAWHILSLDFAGGLALSDHGQTALLVQFQARYNRKPVADLLDLPKRLAADFDLLSLLFNFNSLQAQFSELAQSEYPCLEVRMKDRNSFVVHPWGSVDKQVVSLTVSLQVEDKKLALKKTGEKQLEVVPNVAVLELVNELVLEQSRLKLEELHQHLRNLASRYWALFSDEQILLITGEKPMISIQMNSSVLTISVQSFSGSFVVHSSSSVPLVDLSILLQEGRIDSFVKSLRQERNKQLASALSNLLADSDSFLVADSSATGLSRLSSNHIVFVLTKFVGKLIASDLGIDNVAPRFYLAMEDLASGRYLLKDLTVPFSADCNLNDLSGLLQALTWISDNVFPVILDQELQDRNILAKKIDQFSLALLNLGTLPSLNSIILKMVSNCEAVIEISFQSTPVDHNFVQTALNFSLPITIQPNGRFDLHDLIQRTQCFLALLIISKQLEIRQVKHELGLSYLDFGHAKAGRGRIFYNQTNSASDIPLDISFDHGQQPLSHDRLEAIRGQLRSSANIGMIVDFLNRQ